MKEKIIRLRKEIKNDRALKYIIVGIIAILISPLILSQLPRWFLFTTSGTLGDTIGGITSPIVGTLGAILVYFALKEQVKANKLITDQFLDQRKITVRQNFEQTFFNMLDLHQNIVNNIRVEADKIADLPREFENEGGRIDEWVTKFKKDHKLSHPVEKRELFKVSSELLTLLINNVDSKIAVDEYLKSDFKRDDSLYQFSRDKYLDKDGKEFYSGFRELYLKMFELLDSHLGHYYRLLYRIIKIIDEQDFMTGNDESEYKIKYFYTTIVRSQLSDYEVEWLFYNCLYTYGALFKPLVEEYTLLKIMEGDERKPFAKFKSQYALTAFVEVKWRETTNSTAEAPKFERVPLAEY